MSYHSLQTNWSRRLQPNKMEIRFAGNTVRRKTDRNQKPPRYVWWIHIPNASPIVRCIAGHIVGSAEGDKMNRFWSIFHTRYNVHDYKSVTRQHFRHTACDTTKKTKRNKNLMPNIVIDMLTIFANKLVSDLALLAQPKWEEARPR